MLDPVNRFTSRVENYVKYRPRYPKQVLEILRAECGLTPEWRIADIGSGTGFLTEIFLENGNPTFGVEPNAAMREAAESLLANYLNFTSLDGTAESTGLDGSSVEMVTAGQAFHWFHLAKAKAEFLRILKPGGWVALVWNERRGGTPFLDAYEDLLQKFAPEYGQVDHRRIDDHVLADFFSPAGFGRRSCDNVQAFDLDGITGRLMSSSYAPEPETPGHQEMIDELGRIFEKHQTNGRVLFEYDTNVYFGRLAVWAPPSVESGESFQSVVQGR